MSQNFNIQEFVNEIIQPNALCVVANEVLENPEKRHLHTLYSLGYKTPLEVEQEYLNNKNRKVA
jgi:hypothetical protein